MTRTEEKSNSHHNFFSSLLYVYFHQVLFHFGAKFGRSTSRCKFDWVKVYTFFYLLHTMQE